MSIYSKLNTARVRFHSEKIKKTGKNAFAGFSYLSLDDFLVRALVIFDDVGLCPVVSFTPEVAVMTIHDTESDATIVIESPMAEANLKGCHPIQQMGAVETYQRRYLWVSALEIVEGDGIDATSGKPDEHDDAEARQKLNEILAGLMEAQDAETWAKWKKMASTFCIEQGNKDYADLVKQTIDAKKQSIKTKEAA